ncbi:pyridoxamine 5'-phosphate oxidase [bacterium]|nr:pyridoxamine 5'-phosphate oxidase [bacterium]
MTRQHSADSFVVALRKEYLHARLQRRNLDRNPVEQFRAWLDEAMRAKVEQAEAMTLATCSPTGEPTARIVLLRGCDENGVVFFTDYGSVKGRQLARNPRAALVFFWSGLQRQVRITGTVARVPREESRAYFAVRPRGSQIAAWASRQSAVVKDRAALEQAYEEMAARFEDQDIPLPPRWGGYRLVPDAFEFWQGRRNRLHDRFIYRKARGGAWKITRLAP